MSFLSLGFLSNTQDHLAHLSSLSWDNQFPKSADLFGHPAFGAFQLVGQHWCPNCFSGKSGLSWSHIVLGTISCQLLLEFTVLYTHFLSSSHFSKEYLKISFGFLYSILSVGMLYLCVCICTICGPGAWGRQKKVSHPLELELQMVMKYHVTAGNWIQSLCKSSKCS